MITSALCYLLGGFAGLIAAILPDYALPETVATAFSYFGGFLDAAAAVLPDNTLLHLYGAVTFLLTVHVFVIPWLIAQNVKLPFVGIVKGKTQ